jgi:hypothetical protein
MTLPGFCSVTHYRNLRSFVILRPGWLQFPSDTSPQHGCEGAAPPFHYREPAQLRDPETWLVAGAISGRRPQHSLRGALSTAHQKFRSDRVSSGRFLWLAHSFTKHATRHASHFPSGYRQAFLFATQKILPGFCAVTHIIVRLQRQRDLAGCNFAEH